MDIRADDAGGHLDPLEVAEHAEGLLEPDRAAAVEGHISSCAQCRELAASVAGVTTTLAAAPSELPIPDGVAARIDAALAEEAAAGTRPEPAVVDGFWSRLRGRMPAIAVAAASIAVFGLIGYAISGTGGDDVAETTSDAEAGMVEPEDSGDDAAAPLEGEEEAAEEDAPAAGDESADRELDGDSAESGDEAGTEAGDGAGEQARPETLDREVTEDERDALTAELRDVIAAGSTHPQDAEEAQPCGTVLAEELGGELLGSAATDQIEPDSVLVAIDLGDPDTVSGWVLPGCTAGPDDVLFELTVPRSE